MHLILITFKIKFKSNIFRIEIIYGNYVKTQNCR